jgi:hypothetical protein
MTEIFSFKHMYGNSNKYGMHSRYQTWSWPTIMPKHVAWIPLIYSKTPI